MVVKDALAPRTGDLAGGTPLEWALAERWISQVPGEKVASVKTGTRAAARRANLPGVTPHVLRHTAATWMAMAGVPVIEIVRMLGHRNSRITERVYAKHSPEYLRGAIDALSA